MRIALYARYSSDRQNERSIEDQLALCARHAAAKGWDVVATYTDAAISGSHMANRPGLNAAVAAGERREFDILLAEDEDRIARNLEHQAHVYNRLRVSGVAIATLKSEAIGIVDVALRGVMAELYLVNLSEKTKRGVRSNAEKGLATGSRLYGYRTQPGGATEIVDDEAEVVRRIFSGYAGGLTGRDIVAQLNREGVPGPRGGVWRASTINGSRQRANGILQTELYAGVKVWNRMDVVKDHQTGKRSPRMKPEAEWKRTAVPHLRIVSDDLWRAVQARKAVGSAAMPRSVRQRHYSVFSGLLRCARCGGSYTGKTGGRIMCSTRRELGPEACSNGRSLSRAAIEQRCLDGLRTKLLSPEAVAAYVREFHAARKRRKAMLTDQRGPMEKRVAELTRRLERGAEAVLDGTATAEVRAKMQEYDAERTRLQASLADLRPDNEPAEMHPRLGDAYVAKITTLRDRLAAAAASSEPLESSIIESVRDIVEKIEVRPLSDDWGAPVELTLHGRLALFLRPATEQPPNEWGSRVVAGAGYSSAHPFVPALIRMIA